MGQRSGFTLVEVLVASVIFALVIVGLLSVFSSSRKHSVHVRERISGMELGKFFIDPLHMDVRQDTWATNPLGTKSIPNSSEEINNRQFVVTYAVTDSTTYTPLAGTDLRRVIASITWTEPSP